MLFSLLIIGCGNKKPAEAVAEESAPVEEAVEVRQDVWLSASKTDCLRVSKGNVKDDHSHDDFSPAVDTEFCPGDTWKDVSGGAQNWLVLDVMAGQTYVTTTTVHWAMPVAPWTPYADPISMGSDNKPDGVLTFDKNGDGSYNVSVSKE